MRMIGLEFLNRKSTNPCETGEKNGDFDVEESDPKGSEETMLKPGL